MFRNPFRFTAIVLFVSGCLSAFPASAQSGCVRFESIDHCPFGDTTLTLAPDGSQLAVTGLDPQGDEGVASLFDPTNAWRGELSFAGQNEGDLIVFNAVSEGSVAARARLDWEADESLHITTEFTGAAGANSYSLYVYDDGDLVDVYDDFDESSVLDFRSFPPWLPPERIPPPDTGFPQLRSGACSYMFDFGGDVILRMSSGKQVVTDEVRLIEDVGAPGGYPYAGFESMVIQANGDALVITHEEIGNP